MPPQQNHAETPEPSSQASQALIDYCPFRKPSAEAFDSGQWPCQWIALTPSPPRPFVAAYKLDFACAHAQAARIHVSADERYELFLDGQRIGRGPQRGDILHWSYETYDLHLPQGPHTLVARVSTLGEMAPNAQLSQGHRFLLAAEGEHLPRLSTGLAEWTCMALEGYSFCEPSLRGSRYAGCNTRIEGARFTWGFERGQGVWHAPALLEHPYDRLGQTGEVRHVLRPATLPAMLERPIPPGLVRHVDAPAAPDACDQPILAANHLVSETAPWQEFLSAGRGMTLAPHTHRRVLIDLGDYYCAYTELNLSGGRDARIRVQWAEAIFERPHADGWAKGPRDRIEGGFFVGRGDIFVPDGAARCTFESLWWRCGRYVELLVETSDEPLTLHALKLLETRYPLEMHSRLSCNDARWDTLTPILFRSLQMCSHETYMDCPHYEQLQYVGDTRLQALTTFVSTQDDRLPRKAVKLFEASQGLGGLVQSRYPSRVAQYIPQFSLYWVGMVYDFALWRGDRAFIASMMPAVRAALETFLAHVDDRNLLNLPEGWDWIDWVPGWHVGRPRLDGRGPCGVNHWQLVYVLGLGAQLERWMGEAELAQRLERRRRELAQAGLLTFWDEDQGLLAVSPDRTRFAEHNQCFALLSGLLDDTRARRITHGLLHNPTLDRATIYFQHYLFESFRQQGCMEGFFSRMGLWHDLPGRGFKTTPECPEPCRSDCHAWGAHPIYHFFVSVLGIRPGEFGFETVEIAPQLGPLQQARGEMVHPRGIIRVEFTQSNGRLSAQVELPAGLRGVLTANGQTVALGPGGFRSPISF